MIEFLDSLLSFPVEYDFLKYLVASVLVVIIVTSFYALVNSLIFACFHRR